MLHRPDQPEVLIKMTEVAANNATFENLDFSNYDPEVRDDIIKDVLMHGLKADMSTCHEPNLRFLILDWDENTIHMSMDMDVNSYEIRSKNNLNLDI